MNEDNISTPVEESLAPRASSRTAELSQNALMEPESSDLASSDEKPNEDTSDVDLHGAYRFLAAQQVVMEQRVGYAVSAVAGCITLAITGPMLWLWKDTLWIVLSILLGWLALGSLLIWSSHYWPRIAHRHTSWRLTEIGMEIRRGVWWKHRISIPVARVQHVDVSQGPVQRMFGLGTLTIYTAGTQNSSVELDGLKHAWALTLRDQLIAQKDSLDVT